MANNNPYPTKNVSKSGPARAKVIHSAFMFFEMPMYCHLETTQRRLFRERCCRVASLTLSLALVTALSLSLMPPLPPPLSVANWCTKVDRTWKPLRKPASPRKPAQLKVYTKRCASWPGRDQEKAEEDAEAEVRSQLVVASEAVFHTG